MECVHPFYDVLIRETTDDEINQKLIAFQTDFIKRYPDHSSILDENDNPEKHCQLSRHVNSTVIGRGQLHPSFIKSSCYNSNIVIYLHREKNNKLPELIKTLGFLTANVINRDILELELIGASFIYKGCGSELFNSFLLSAKAAGFSYCYLNSLLSPFEFYQKQGLTFTGLTDDGKIYFHINLKTNHIQPPNISRIKFNPPKPGTQFVNPELNQLLKFMSPNKPFRKLTKNHLARIANYNSKKKTTSNGRHYLSEKAFGLTGKNRLRQIIRNKVMKRGSRKLNTRK